LHVGQLRLSVCRVVCLFVCSQPTARNLYQTLCASMHRSREELVKFSRSWGSKVKVTQRWPWKSCELDSWWTPEWISTKTYTNSYYIWETNWLGFQGHEGQRSRSRSDDHGNILNSIDAELLKRFQHKNYTSADCTWDMNWLRSQCHRVKG